MKKKLVGVAFIGCVLLGMLMGCTDKIEVSSEKVMSPVSELRPVVKVFIENSGSMNGYMCEGSQLKDAVFDYVSDLNGCVDSTELYYINSRVIPFSGKLERYIKTLTPATFRQAGGNLQDSDLGQMIEAILNGMNDSTVCLFVSDCILDLPASDSQKFLNTCQISIKNTLNEARQSMSRLGVEVLKLTSDFNGRYFYQNGQSEVLQNVQRPYYLWIFGDHRVLAQLNKEVPLKGLEKYGLQGIVAFAPEVAVPYEVSNKTTTSQVIGCENGEYIAVIRADFSATLQPENTIQDAANYAFHNPSLSLQSIQPITAKGNPYTHCLTFTIPESTRIVQGNLTFYASGLPGWVEDSNDESGKDIRNNLMKTTGIRHLIGGVADSYKNDNVSTNFKFTVKHK